MSVEQIKSIILTGLVLLSIFLFGYIMTFQQSYDRVNNQEYVEEITISHKIDIKELIHPKKIVWKKDGQYVGSEAMIDIQPIINEIQKWNFYDFNLATEEFAAKWRERAEALIFQYDDIPLELIKTILSVEQDGIPNILYHYMFIFPGDLEKQEAVVYFASSDLRTAVKSRVKYHDQLNFIRKLQEFADKSSPYLVYEHTAGSMIFVKNDPHLEVKTYPYYTMEIPIQAFVEVLFPDPSVVTKTENTYTNGTSLLEVNEDHKTIHFVNPTVAKNQAIAPSQIIQTAMNFVNQHGGWTDQYLFSHFDAENQEVIFQLFLSDYMVVGSNYLSVSIGNSGIYAYRRPYFSLNFPVQPYVKTLPSGQEVLDYLEATKKIDLAHITDIAIGYEMTFMEEDSMFLFEPFWYYRIGSDWLPVFEAEQGGEHNGLE